MRIIVGMHHPKHFWMFKNLITVGQNKGWEFLVLISKKDVLEDLLKSSGIKYLVIGQNQPSIFKKIIELFKQIYYTYKYSTAFNPDVYIGQTFIHFGIVSTLLQSPYYIFEDTKDASILHFFTIPFCTKVITPKPFEKSFGKKHIIIKSVFEFAYLHPDCFKAKETVHDFLGLSKGEKFAIIRFVSWNAHHDFGKAHMSVENKIKLVSEIEKHLKVFISSEGDLPKELEKNQINIPTDRMHDVLYYASLYFGESPTMTTESAILGTPAICVSSWAYDNGTFKYLSQYGLIESYKDFDVKTITQNISDWLGDDDIKKEWQKRRKEMLIENINVTSYMVSLLDYAFINRKH